MRILEIVRFGSQIKRTVFTAVLFKQLLLFLLENSKKSADQCGINIRGQAVDQYDIRRRIDFSVSESSLFRLREAR